MSWQTKNFDIPQHSNNEAYHSQRLYEIPVYPHAYVNQQPPNLTPFDFNQSVVKLFRHQTELTHSTLLLCQQTTNTLENIGKSSSFQANQHFIDDIQIFKAKDLQSFDDWLEQIDKVALLTNKDPYKLALAKLQGSYHRMISSFPPSMGWNKIWLHYNFGSAATKQHAALMLRDQQQKPTETLQEYVLTFADLLLKCNGLLPPG